MSIIKSNLGESLKLYTNTLSKLNDKNDIPNHSSLFFKIFLFELYLLEDSLISYIISLILYGEYM